MFFRPIRPQYDQRIFHALFGNNSLGHKLMAIIHKMEKTRANDQSNLMCRRTDVGYPEHHDWAPARSVPARLAAEANQTKALSMLNF
uniref:Uncharacterized protein n=1 Tax=Globodera rostochiensis TaxID=31243 RepID=A0A914H8P0_GLORO